MSTPSRAVPKTRREKWDQANEKTIAALDIVKEYESLGVVITGKKPSASGWLSCWANGRPHGNSPSAAINVSSGPLRGHYRDLGGDGESLPFWKFCERYGGFPSWRDAQKKFADQVGVVLPEGREEKPDDSIAFEPMLPTFNVLAHPLVKRYPGISAEALLLCGAQLALYPKSSKTPQRCIAVPAYGATLFDGGPRGYSLMRLDGKDIELYRGKDTPPDFVKRLTKGSTGLVGTHGLQQLATCEFIWKVEGLSDLFALQDKIPRSIRDKHIALTNLCGCSESSLPGEIAHLFKGKKLCIVHDCDRPGQEGVKPWVNATIDFAEVRNILLPYPILPSKGKDLRNWLVEDGATFKDLVDLARKTPPITIKVAAPILIDQENLPVAGTLGSITDSLLAQGNVFTRAQDPVQIVGDQIFGIGESEQLAGTVSTITEVIKVEDGSRKYIPLPTNYATTWLNNCVEKGRLPEIRLFTRNPTYTGDYRVVWPGFDPDSGIYYAGPTIQPSNSRHHLNTLLSEFCFRDPKADRTNFLGVLLTIVLISKFIGSKPALLLNGNQPNLGKSILAQIVAIIRDGCHVETCSYTENDGEFEKRLGSRVKSGATTLIIDNAKPARGRGSAIISSACLERSITDPILSFRLLGYSADIRAENSHIFIITANCSEVSRDLVTRSVVVNLHYDGDPTERPFAMQDPEGYAEENRLEILSELLGMVEVWKAAKMPLSTEKSRFNKKSWAQVIGGILMANGEPDFLGNAAAAVVEFDQQRREFEELVGLICDHPGLRWKPGELAEKALQNKLLIDSIGDGSDRSKAIKMGFVLSQYVDAQFKTNGGTFRLHFKPERKGTEYWLEADEPKPIAPPSQAHIDEIADRLLEIESQRIELEGGRS